MFSCLYCHEILFEPTTLICGHCFCKHCFQKENKEGICKKCNERQDDSFPVKIDVLLSRQLEKYFPSVYRARKLRNEGNLKYEQGDYNEAVKLYSEATTFARLDHLILSKRPAVSSSKNYVTESTKGETGSLTPKYYFEQGCALMVIGKYDDALLSLLQCLSLDSNFTNGTKMLAKVLQNILTPLSSEDRILLDSDQQECQRDTSISKRNIFDNRARTGPLDLTISQRSLSIDSNINHFTKCQDYSKKTQQTTDKESDTSEKYYIQRKRRHSDPIIKRDFQAGKKISLKGIKETLQVIPDHLLNRNDYDCSLCFRLLHEPVTTPCGHTFCSGCLKRCLDHKSQCPLCKDSLSEYLANKKMTVNLLLRNILKQYFKKDAKEREEIYAKELEALRSIFNDEKEAVIPVFICTIALPTIPCPLYIFEPRYKLMIRQCIESGSSQFGMCVSSSENGFSDYGSMLEIQDVQVLPDGRSAIKTIGTQRFIVIDRDVRDGYNTALVKLLEDEVINENEMDSLKVLHQSVYAEAFTWFQELSQSFRLKVIHHYGTMPSFPDSLLNLSDGPRWIWWLLTILPIFEHVKVRCLAMTSIKERLTFIRNHLRELSREG